MIFSLDWGLTGNNSTLYILVLSWPHIRLRPAILVEENRKGDANVAIDDC